MSPSPRVTIVPRSFPMPVWLPGLPQGVPGETVEKSIFYSHAVDMHTLFTTVSGVFCFRQVAKIKFVILNVPLAKPCRNDGALQFPAKVKGMARIADIQLIE